LAVLAAFVYMGFHGSNANLYSVYMNDRNGKAANTYNM